MRAGTMTRRHVLDQNFWSKENLLRYVGNLEQLCGIRSSVLTEGKARDVRILDVRTGSGLEFTVVPDRALDLANLTFRGTNLSFASPTGLVAPAFYDQTGLGWLRSFHAGFLTTCGLRNAGSPSQDEGEELGLHGRIGNLPGVLTRSSTDWVEGRPVLTVAGSVREARFFGENLVLRRTITARAGESSFILDDLVENEGFRTEPLTLLYHFNLGYPLIDSTTRIWASTGGPVPRDDVARSGVARWDRGQQPTPGYQEQVFYHDLRPGTDGRVGYLVENPGLELAVLFRWNRDALPRFTQWKQLGVGEYVIGIEPCNCHPEGRSQEKVYGTLETLAPGETKHCRIEVEVLSGAAGIAKARDALLGPGVQS